MGIIWTIIIGFIAGLLARFIVPGNREPSGFILTTILGIAGAFLAGFIGQAVGWYGEDEGPRLIASTIGAIIILVAWGAFTRRR
jgi:uncharacterized membrane protein YeaQ/YmgE (transglycosylase-associated protein family)